MNWIVLKSLNELYINREVKAKKTVLNDSTVQFFINSTGDLTHIKKCIKVNKNSGFNITYENLFKKEFEDVCELLKKYNINDRNIRFNIDDLKILLSIEKQMISGQLEPLRMQIIEAKESIRGVSQMFFINDKYLDKKVKLVSVLEIILKVPPLPSGKDKQYLYVIPCKNPKHIVLCENLHFLKIPELVRPHNIELWYAGGYNVKMLDFVDLKGLPVFYSCDWDNDGLKIYKLVKEKISKIKLLFPNGEYKSIEKTEHKSHWVHEGEDFLKESEDIFNKKQKTLIQKLISNNEWIIEESNDLIKEVNDNK